MSALVFGAIKVRHAFFKSAVTIVTFCFFVFRHNVVLHLNYKTVEATVESRRKKIFSYFGFL